MSATPGRAGRRDRKRRSWARIFLVSLLTVATFVVGIALGKSLEATPEPGPAVTETRTIVPIPATEVTVTVTTTVPP